MSHIARSSSFSSPPSGRRQYSTPSKVLELQFELLTRDNERIVTEERERADEVKRRADADRTSRAMNLLRLQSIKNSGFVNGDNTEEEC